MITLDRQGKPFLQLQVTQVIRGIISSWEINSSAAIKQNSPDTTSKKPITYELHRTEAPPFQPLPQMLSLVNFWFDSPSDLSTVLTIKPFINSIIRILHYYNDLNTYVHVVFKRRMNNLNSQSKTKLILLFIVLVPLYMDSLQ